MHTFVSRTRFVRSGAGRALATLVTLGLLVGALAVAPASAGHNEVRGDILVWRGSNLVAIYSMPVEGTGEAFNVDIMLPRRDYNRFVRWCGGTSKQVTVTTGALTGFEICEGPSAWFIVVAAWLIAGTPTTHGSDVSVTVNALPPA